MKDIMKDELGALVRKGNEEIVINVNLSESATHGRIVCGLVRTAGTNDAERKAFREHVEALIKRHHGERVYVAGDVLKLVDLDEMARTEEIELDHRNLAHHRVLMETDRRLQDLHNRILDPKTIAVFNGLPSTPEAVDVLGPFAGDAAHWLQFRTNVEDATANATRAPLTTKDALFAELSSGQEDVLILVAHASGMTLYLNSETVSLAEIEALPTRSNPARQECIWMAK